MSQLDSTSVGSRLLLSTREAARALSIFEKTLYNHTQPRGDLPCVRIGAAVRYAITDLEHWIVRRKEVCQ